MSGTGRVWFGRVFFDNGDVGWAWFDFENGGFDKGDRDDFGAWQMLWFGSLIKIKINEC